MIQTETKKNVTSDAGEQFRLFPAVVLILLMLTFIGSGIYIMVDSYFL